MMEFRINGKTIQFDEGQKYCDYHIHKGKRRLLELDMPAFLAKIESGDVPVDNKLESQMVYLSRLSDIKAQYSVYKILGSKAPSDYAVLFNDCDDETINYAANAGKFAKYFLKEIYNK